MRLDWTDIGDRIPEANGLEVDVFDKRTRRIFNFKCGVTTYAKRSYSRRLRRTTRLLLKTYDFEREAYEQWLGDEAEELYVDMRAEGFDYEYDDFITSVHSDPDDFEDEWDYSDLYDYTDVHDYDHLAANQPTYEDW